MNLKKKHILYIGLGLVSILLTYLVIQKFWLVRDTPGSNPYYQQNNVVENDSVLKYSAFDMVFGDSMAPLTIVMFSNYYCGYCIDFFEQCFPELDKDYLQTGKVRLIVKWLTPLMDTNTVEAMKMVACLNKYGHSDKIHQLLLFNPKVVHTPEFKDMVAELMTEDDNIHLCLTGQNSYLYLKENIKVFRKLELKGTPAFVIKNKLYKGYYGSEFFIEWVQYEYNMQRWPLGIQ